LPPEPNKGKRLIVQVQSYKTQANVHVHGSPGFLSSLDTHVETLFIFPVRKTIRYMQVKKNKKKKKNHPANQ
jgi:hypothetical protein